MPRLQRFILQAVRRHVQVRRWVEFAQIVGLPIWKALFCIDATFWISYLASHRTTFQRFQLRAPIVGEAVIKLLVKILIRTNSKITWLINLHSEFLSSIVIIVLPVVSVGIILSCRSWLENVIWFYKHLLIGMVQAIFLWLRLVSNVLLAQGYVWRAVGSDPLIEFIKNIETFHLLILPLDDFVDWAEFIPDLFPQYHLVSYLPIVHLLVFQFVSQAFDHLVILLYFLN